MVPIEPRSLLDHAPGLLCALDERHRCLLLNAHGARWLGIDAQAAVGRTLASLVGPAAWISIRGHLEVVRHERIVTFEHELVFAFEGTRRVRTTLARPETGPGVFVAVQDVHERLELEQRLVSNADQLERTHATFRALIEQSPDGIIVHRDGHIVYANPAQVHMTGYRSADELIGMRTEQLAPPEERREALEIIEAASTGLQTSARHLRRMLRKDGSVVEVELIVLSITFEGEPALLASVRDMSERRELIARMMQMDRMITAGTLAAGVGHEINNPLAYLLGNLEFVLENLADRASTPSGRPSDAEIIKALEAARDGALRIKQVTADLRALSRTEPRTFAPVDLRRAIESALNMAGHELQHRATVVLELRPTPPVLGDDARLSQMIVNLLINAAHAIDEGEPESNEIRVQCHFDPSADRVRIEIHDTGSGIPQELREHLFDPFVTSKPLSQGTGLGLAICRQIVDSHHGEITFETATGRGTTFRVTLPAIAAPASSPAPVLPDRPARARVLLIDDDPLLVDVFARVLRTEHEVVTFTCSKQALAHLLAMGVVAGTYDVILCDLMMPELSGIELFERVTEQDPNAGSRFLFMTGGAFTPRGHQFVQQHRDRTLHKPIPVRLLRERVGLHCAHAARTSSEPTTP